MATNRTAGTAMAAKQYELPKKDEWNAEEERVFKELGIGEGEVSLRKLIRGQRRINGKLYEGIEVIFDHLQKGEKSKTGSPDPKLAEFAKQNAGIPAEDPPRCEKGLGK